MISETFHISENSTTWDEGWNDRPAYAHFQFTALTYMQIKNVSVRVGCNTSTYDVNGNFYLELNGTQVFSGAYTLYADDGASQWISFSPNITVNTLDVVNIYTETGAGRQARAYYGTSGDFIIGMVANPTNAAEMILDIDYVPIWTIDSQNDGYPYPAGTDPTEFTEFAKDADGYPLNWGVWKLDDQNEGYPWPTGFLPVHVAGGGIYKKINGVLYPVSIYKKVNGVLYPVMVYKKVNGSLVPI